MSHSIFVAEKYGSGSEPGALRRSTRRAARAPDIVRAVRRSCQTMARCTGRPVARSQMTIVSRWLVMPIATGGARQRRSRRAPQPNAVEDLHRVVLDPARLREILRNFAVTAAGDASIFADHETGRAGRPFVDRQDVFHSGYE